MDISRLLSDPHIDDITKKEVRKFAEMKYDEQDKLKGQIARDLSRLGENAYTRPSAYDKLRAKYRAGHAGMKKLAILDLMQREWGCTND